MLRGCHLAHDKRSGRDFYANLSESVGMQEPVVAGAVELDAGFQAALAHDRLRHEQVLERIRLTRHAQTIAMRIAREQRPYPGLNASQTQRALRALELIGVAERSARGEWTITDPLLGRDLADLPQAGARIAGVRRLRTASNA